MERIRRAPIGEWGSSMGLVYGEFRGKENPGVIYFDLFKNMVKEMQPSALKPNGDFQQTVRFDDRDYFLSFRINYKKTFDQDDYKPITRETTVKSLQWAMEKKAKPFWIEIKGTWSSILFTDGKWNYQAIIILDKKK